MKPSKSAKLAALIFVLIALLAGAYTTAYVMLARGGEIVWDAKRIDSAISANLQARNLYPPAVQKNFIAKQNGKSEWEQIEVIVNIDKTASLPALVEALKAELGLSNLDIVEETDEHDPSFIKHQISVYREALPIYQLLILQERSTPARGSILKETPSGELHPKIALIIDDAGYDLDRALELLNLRRPMSISVLPKLKYSRHVAEMAHDMGYEVMMHLPMESGENLRRSPGFVAADMTETEMYWILDRNLESIPFVRGVNNHQGSMMTRDAEAMARLMKYLGGKDMFFVDSRTTSETVAYRTAKESGLRAAENNMFLDNEKDLEYIKERIRLLMQEAREKGKAIGICHVHPETTRALHEMFPVIEEEGIALVFASELAE